MSRGVEITDPEDETKTKMGTEKVSMYRIASELVDSDPLTARQKSILFPNWRLLSTVKEKIDMLKIKSRNSLTNNKRTKIKFLSMSLPRTDSLTITSLKDAVAGKWFGITRNHSLEACRTSFETYKESFKWLKDTYSESYGKGSPFESGFTLLNFISSCVTTNKSVKLLTTSRGALGLSDSLVDVIKSSQTTTKSMYLEEDKSDKDEEHDVYNSTGDFGREKISLLMLKELPDSKSRDKTQLMKTILRTETDPDVIENKMKGLKFMSERDAELLLAVAISHNIRVSFETLLIAKKSSSCILYIKAQKRDKRGRYHGEGLAYIIKPGKTLRAVKVSWDRKGYATIFGRKSDLLSDSIKKSYRDLNIHDVPRVKRTDGHYYSSIGFSDVMGINYIDSDVQLPDLNRDIDVNWRSGTIRFIDTTEGSSVGITLLDLSHLMSDYGVRVNTGDKFVDNFLSNTPLDINDYSALIRNLPEEDKDLAKRLFNRFLESNNVRVGFRNDLGVCREAESSSFADESEDELEFDFDINVIDDVLVNMEFENDQDIMNYTEDFLAFDEEDIDIDLLTNRAKTQYRGMRVLEFNKFFNNLQSSLPSAELLSKLKRWSEMSEADKMENFNLIIEVPPVYQFISSLL